MAATRRLLAVLLMCASVAALRLPAAQAVVSTPTHNAHASRHARRTSMVDQVEEVLTPEEQEQAWKDKETRLARIAAVNAGQVAGGQSFAGKAFSIAILFGVFAAAIYIGDPQNCEFLPAAKADTCMAQGN